MQDDASDPVNGDWRNVGDWTGDGLEDFVAGAPWSSTVGVGHGEIFLFSGSDVRGEFLRDEAAGSWVGDEDEAALGTAIHTPDFDGDDIPDLVPSGAGPYPTTLTVLRGGDVPALRSALPVERIMFGWPLAYSIIPGDYDADGFDDLFHVVYTDDEPTRIGIVRGFDVPWDDPSYW